MSLNRITTGTPIAKRANVLLGLKVEFLKTDKEAQIVSSKLTIHCTLPDTHKTEISLKGNFRQEEPSQIAGDISSRKIASKWPLVAWGLAEVFSPLIYLFPLENSYNILISALPFILAPGSVFVSARVFGFNKSTATLSAILALAPSLNWYRWFISYGTLGFITSACLFPLCLALVYGSLISNDRQSTLRLIITVFVSFLYFFWTPAYLAAAPIGLLILFKIKNIFANKKLLLSIIFLVAMVLPFLIIFVSASKVANFVSDPGEPQQLISNAKSIRASLLNNKGFSLTTAFRILREYGETLNLALLCFGLPGILLIKNKTLRLSFIVVTCWLLFLVCVGAQLHPKLELERLLNFLAFILCLSSGTFLYQLHEIISSSSAKLARLVEASILALSIISLLAVVKVTSNQSAEKIYHNTSQFTQLVKSIKELNNPGRILFTGFVLHELDQGHVAPLPYFTDKTLYASRYQHDRWRYTDVIPKHYLSKGSRGVEKFFDLMNISHIITHEPTWRGWANKRDKRYTLLSKAGRFSIYHRKREEYSWFLEGSGEILKQTENSILLNVYSSEAVIKFNYLPFLTSNNCKLSPYPVAGDINFIKLTECTGEHNSFISSENPIKRFF